MSASVRSPHPGIEGRGICWQDNGMLEVGFHSLTLFAYFLPVELYIYVLAILLVLKHLIDFLNFL